MRIPTIVFAGLVIGACVALPAPSAQQPPAATLVTDSTEYSVRFEGGFYRATIGYRYTNRSGHAVSANYCRTPPPPVLEKKVGAAWVRAYSPIMLMCLSHPPFRIAVGETYRGVLALDAAPRGRNAAPTFDVESVPGTYRLRWRLVAGSDPDAKDAPAVEAVSNEFRLVER